MINFAIINLRDALKHSSIEQNGGFLPDKLFDIERKYYFTVVWNCPHCNWYLFSEKCKVSACL